MEIKGKTLYRSSDDRYIAGVCGGLGEFFDVDPLVFRLIFLLLLFFGGGGLILYIILWILMPEKAEKRAKNLNENIKQGANKMAEEIKEKSSKEGNGRVLIGVIILVVGLIFLGREFFPFLNIGMDKLWPLIVVAIGVSILLKANNKDENETPKEKK